MGPQGDVSLISGSKVASISRLGQVGGWEEMHLHLHAAFWRAEGFWKQEIQAPDPLEGEPLCKLCRVIWRQGWDSGLRMSKLGGLLMDRAKVHRTLHSLQSLLSLMSPA